MAGKLIPAGSRVVLTYRLTIAPLPITTSSVVFDITRLYRNRDKPFGTGIDRIDLAIGRDLVERFGAQCRFVHVCFGGFTEISVEAGQALLRALDDRWHLGREARFTDISKLTLLKGRLKAALGADRLAQADVTYVVASHSGLPQRAGYLRRFDPQGRAVWLAYIHDLIPITYPEYQTDRSRRIFTRYLAELATGPVRFLANSADTAEELVNYAGSQGWVIEAPKAIIPGIEQIESSEGAQPVRAEIKALVDGERPFFLILGTIEPRKNHILLLHIWRQMAQDGVPPLLVIVGKRGWMTENVAAILDRSVVIAPHVREFGDLGDGEVACLIEHARALLFPSFAEGLGVPLLEAQAAGVPVIASDLPAFREIAGPDVVFLDPTDGPAWRHAIKDMAAS